MDVLFALPPRAPLTLDVPLADAVPQLVAPVSSAAIVRGATVAVRGATSKGTHDHEIR